MYEGHMEALQIIVAVQRPVGIDGVIDAAFFYEFQSIHRHPGDALAHGLSYGFEACEGIQGDKKQPQPLLQ